MLTVHFDCTVETPWFLAGANQARAEARVPSLRGALRYWLRALLGGTGLHHQALAEAEAHVFGNTQQGSPVTVRLRMLDPLVVRRAETLLGRYKSPSQKTLHPITYLWYTTKLGENNRGYIPPEPGFRVTFQAAGQHEKALLQAISAFWLLAHCGGLGTRSRRMAGSFLVRRVDAPNHLPLPSFAPWDPAFKGDFAAYFTQQLTTIRGPMGALAPTLPQPDFDVWHPAWTNLYLAGLPDTTWEKTVEHIGRAFRDFRSRNGAGKGGDYDQIKQYVLRGTAPQTVQRAAFGLPLTFRFTKGEAKGKQADVQVQTSGSSRRASPLWLRLVRLPDGRMDTLVTVMKSQFLPGASDVRIQGRGQRPATPPNPSYTILDDFRNSLNAPTSIAVDL